MSHTLTKKGFRGFTLIELLVVIAIIGLLSTIIATPIQNARKKAKDAKKVSELKALELALDQYAEANNNQYPTNLSILSPRYMPVLPTFVTATSTTPKDAFIYSYYSGVSSGQSNVVFGYHLGVHLDVYGPALESDRDCLGATVGTSLVSPACVVWNGDSVVATNANAAVTNGIANVTSGLGTSVSGSDFQGVVETSTDACTTVSTCVFDITSQQ